MTTYYVDFTNGNDANNGLGPDASHATNKPWKTIGKALGAAGIASGDTVYLAPGTYRETVTVAMASAVAETLISGDPANAQGFKTAAGVRVAAGDVIWTAYTTNDTTAPAATLLNLAGRDFLTFENIIFVGGTNCIVATATNSVNITLRQCTLLPGAVGPTTALVNYTGLADVASNWTIDRCIFAGSGSQGIQIILPTSGVADYDSNFLIRNCVFIGLFTTAINATSSGALANKGGGVDVLNCTIWGAPTSGVATPSANMSTSIPCTVYNSIIIAGTALNANTSGQIVEDYNRLWATTARTNVSAGANSIATNAHALLVEVGQAVLMGRSIRPFLTPTSGSPLLGFGNQAGAPSVDLLNRPRPAGGGSTAYAVGAYERHETAAQETGTVRTGANAINITGPGDHQFDVTVDAVLTTIAIYARYDTNHGAGNKPQMSVVNGTECGVVDATATMTAAVDTWEQISLSFTPARAGIVTVRLISRAAAGNGKAFFDDFTRSP